METKDTSDLEAVLDAHRDALGRDFAAYRNHVCRMLAFYEALTGGPAPEAVRIAAAFHDLGIWAARTFDYLPPSIALAHDHVQRIGRDDLAEPVRLLILEHHKLRPYRGPHADVVEPFRRADLVDLSLGLIRCGLPRLTVRQVRSTWSNAGFHARLVQLGARQLLRTPWRPLPMFRW